MLKGLYTAYTGMLNQQNRMDIMTNNLANADTTGYKKEGATSQAFDSVMAVKIKDVTEGGSGANARRLGYVAPGVKIGENYTDYSEGSLRETGNTYDLALTDAGFFNIEFTNKAGETSTKYTRDGNFTLTTGGYLVTQDGDFVLGTNGQHIRLNPLLETSINENGVISQNGTTVATLRLTDFADYDYLEKYGENLYQTIEGATTQAVNANTQVYSGYLESSNVSVVNEMVNMISIARDYESNQKLVQTYDSSLDVTVNQLGKV
ncbi:MAG: flagellar basal-body rod protein FlgF [Lachnospiraceae bacterium]|nr:flagellar basal-body rod protein FlgF [Lachnospiraceae bacterium]